MTIGLAFAIAAVLVSLMFGPNGARRLRELRAERQKMAEQALLLMAENGRLRQDIGHLRKDPGYLERIARRELRLVQPNEVIYRFGDGRR